MGVAAGLFYSSTTGDQSLYRRVSPTDEQFEGQKGYWNHLMSFLKTDLAERSGLSISSWLQGSYKFGTQIRPAEKGGEFDIDLGVYFQWRGDHDDGDFSPIELKLIVQESLLSYADDLEHDVVRVDDPKHRCARIHFTDDFHIDVPAYHLDPSADQRALATEDDIWEDSDPKALVVWWTDLMADNLRARARRIVKYMKMWAALKVPKDYRPSSIMLTVLVANAIQELDVEDASGDDEWFTSVSRKVADVFADSTVVSNPVDDSEDLNRLSDENRSKLLTSFNTLASLCETALAKPSKAEASEAWSDVFDHFFPVPEEDEIIKEAAGQLVAFTFDPQVGIVARPKGTSNLSWNDVNSIGPIPRDCLIEFKLLNANELPAGATVKWRVRNEGIDAEFENDLGHPAGTGTSCTEHSEYKGTHFMDVSVLRFGQLIGRRRVPVTISAQPSPRRNRPRPSWVRFRGR